MSFNIYEEECRKIFQETLGVAFETVRPDWLKNPLTFQNLELDGYNPDVITPLGKGLAFEYDGIQHSEFIPSLFHSCKEHFYYQKLKDSMKDKMCRDKGVLLIRIPHYILFRELQSFIIGRLLIESVKIDLRQLST